MPKPTKQPNPDDNSFGARLIRFRTASDLTRDNLRERLLKKGFSTSYETIKNWETKGQTPSGEVYHHLITQIKRAGY